MPQNLCIVNLAFIASLFQHIGQPRVQVLYRQTDSIFIILFGLFLRSWHKQ